MNPRPARPVAIGVALAVALVVVLLAGGMLTRSYVARAFGAAERVRDLRMLSGRAIKDQLDEETGLRGYAATGERLFLEPYYQAARDLPDVLDDLAARLAAAGLPRAAEGVREAGRINTTWRATVVAPLLRRARPNGGVLQRRGKVLVDQYRAVLIGRVDPEIDASEGAAVARARQAIDRIDAFLALLAVATLTVGLIFLRHSRAVAERLERARLRLEKERATATGLRAAYETEKRIADRLQDAIAQRPLPNVPMLCFSATYVPATEETKVGGDWYDAFELPEKRVLFAIGDVAGHGIEAAVTMSRARQSLAGCALLDDDPASVLARVNRELCRENAPMVTAVAGFADARTFEFAFAAAGHPPPILLEPNRKPRMLDCGELPLAIDADATYLTHRIQSVPGAMLVLYTDGAVEHSRDVIAGEALLLEATARVSEMPHLEPARVIHDAIFAGRTVGDDVAILTVTFDATVRAGLTLTAEKARTTVAARVARRDGDGEAARFALRRCEDVLPLRRVS